jgi:cytochrome c553
MPDTSAALNRLLRAAGLCCLILAGTAGRAQADPIAGRALFDGTIATTGISTLTGDCTSCHGTVQERRTKIGGNPYAEISLALAGNRLGQAIATVPGMLQFQALSQKQLDDLAAYIADTPETSTDQLNFTASAVNTPTADQFVELRHARATSDTLYVVGVSITGGNATRFRSSNTCELQTLAPGGTCRVTVSYSAPDTAGAIVPLTFTLRQGSSTTNFSRTMYLNGAVAVAAPPPAAGGSSADDGGGAVGWSWLLGLALACVALWAAARMHRAAPRTATSRHVGRVERR